MVVYDYNDLKCKKSRLEGLTNICVLFVYNFLERYIFNKLNDKKSVKPKKNLYQFQSFKVQ